MPTAPQYTFWFGVTVFEILSLYIAFRCGQIRRFWALYLLFGVELCASLLRFAILERNGFSSREYVYLYYYTDAILILITFLVVAGLFAYAYNLKTWNGIPLRLTIAGVLCLALFSYATAWQAESRRLLRFALEFSESLFFAIVILATAGWIATLLKKLPARAEVRLLWVFTIYGAILSTAYVARTLYPGSYIYSVLLPPFAGLWLVAGAAFAVLFDDAGYA